MGASPPLRCFQEPRAAFLAISCAGSVTMFTSTNSWFGETSMFQSLAGMVQPLGFTQLGAAGAKKAKKAKAPKPKLYCKVKGSCIYDRGLFGNNQADEAWYAD